MWRRPLLIRVVFMIPIEREGGGLLRLLLCLVNLKEGDLSPSYFPVLYSLFFFSFFLFLFAFFISLCLDAIDLHYGARLSNAAAKSKQRGLGHHKRRSSAPSVGMLKNLADIRPLTLDQVQVDAVALMGDADDLLAALNQTQTLPNGTPTELNKRRGSNENNEPLRLDSETKHEIMDNRQRTPTDAPHSGSLFSCFFLFLSPLGTWHGYTFHSIDEIATAIQKDEKEKKSAENLLKVPGNNEKDGDISDLEVE